MPRISIMADLSYLDDHCSDCLNIFDQFLNKIFFWQFYIKKKEDVLMGKMGGYIYNNLNNWPSQFVPW